MSKDIINVGSVGSSMSLLTKLTDGREFPVWKKKMVALFRARGLMEVIERQVIMSAVTNSTSSKVDLDAIDKSNQAFALISLGLGAEQMRLILQVEDGDAHGAWKVLLDHYERDTVATKIQVYQQLFSCRMSSGFDEYLADISNLVLRLKGMKEQVSDTFMICILLQGLPPVYESLQQAVMVKDNITFAEVVKHIRDAEVRLVNQEGRDVPDAGSAYRARTLPFKSNNYKRDDICFTCQQRGHVSYDCPNNKNAIKCKKCRRVGHWSENCKSHPRNFKDRDESEEEREVSRYAASF